MGWIEKIKIGTPPHQCLRPELFSIMKEGIDVGSIWECPKCKTRYMFTGGYAGVAEWKESYPI